MQLTEEQFVADWKKHMGLFHPICTASVVRYLNLRAQADAGPVGDESQMPRVHGVSRIADNPCSVLVMLMAEPSDDALREIHDRLRAQSGQRAGVAEGSALEPLDHVDLPAMPSNVSHVVRRIRRCEGESGAQVVLEHFAMEYAKSAQSQIRETAWQAWISDAHRDQYIEAFLESLATAADRETERYMTRSFMGGWPMWVQANPREVSKTWFAVADSEPIELMPVLVSYHQHNNPSYPRSYGVAYRAEGVWVSDETGERIHVPTHWMHINQIAAAPTQQQEGGQ